MQSSEEAALVDSIAVRTPIGWLKVSGDNGFITKASYIDGAVDFEQHNCSPVLPFLVL